MEGRGQVRQGSRQGERAVRRLLPAITRDNGLKERYFEAYYHVVYSFVKHGSKPVRSRPQGQGTAARRRASAGTRQEWTNYGGDASAKRFNDLLSREPQFKEMVDRLRSTAN